MLAVANIDCKCWPKAEVSSVPHTYIQHQLNLTQRSASSNHLKQLIKVHVAHAEDTFLLRSCDFLRFGFVVASGTSSWIFLSIKL